MSVRSEIVRLLDGVTELGKRNYADQRPEGEAMPMTIVLDGLSESVGLAGDSGRVMHWKRLCQVDLWEDAEASSLATIDAVKNVLDGARIVGAFHLHVTSSDRIYDPDPRLVHTAITCTVVRPRVMSS